MSTESVRQVLTRATAEPAFLALLCASPTQALAGYELTAAEAAALTGVSPESFDAATAALEARVSMAQPTGFLFLDGQPTGFEP